MHKLLPSDVPVAIALALSPDAKFRDLASSLGIALSSAHRSVERLQHAGLLLPGKRQANRLALQEFLNHGLRYSFFGSLGAVARGVPTAHSAPPLSREVAFDRAVVWPSPDGDLEGESIVPLYENAPQLPRLNPGLYELLALVDAMRIGNARERQMASDFLSSRLLRTAA